MVLYSILFDSSSTNRMQPEVKHCKAEIGKGKNESSMWRQSVNQAETISSRGKCVYDLEGDRNPAYKQC